MASYADIAELQQLLRIDNPSTVQQTAMQRVLDAAADEIDWELDIQTFPLPSPTPALVVEVNLERAVEHWKQSYSPFGIIGLGAETVPIVASRDSWYRHARKLASLKPSWGVA